VVVNNTFVSNQRSWRDVRTFLVFFDDLLGAEANKVFLAFNRRFDPGHAALKKAIEAGEIGNLEQLTITSRDPAPPPLEYIRIQVGSFEI
jgi:hypothetical protein